MSTINDFYCGDEKLLERDVDTTDVLPDVLSSATLIVRRRRSDTDAQAVISKSITGTLSADGQIDEDGSTSSPTGSAHLFFILTTDDTDALSPFVLYYYDITATSSGGASLDIDSGRIQPKASGS